MSDRDIVALRDSAGIVTIAWDLQDRAVNVLTQQSVAAFSDGIERALGDETVVGIIVASRKRDFLAGLDLASVELEKLDLVADAVDAFRVLTRRMETGGKPIVATLGGSALGGGAELALGCHYRIGANDAPRARFGFPEVTLGLLPGAGGTQRVPRLCGVAASLPILLEGKRLTFEAALAAGLIDELAPSVEMHARAHAWILAHRDASAQWDTKGFRMPGGATQSPAISDTFASANAMLQKKTWGNYPAPHAILSAVYEGTLVDIDAGLKIEGAYFRRLLAGPEARAMVKTLFFSVGRANKLEMRSASARRATFAHVGVLGAGMMGAGIALAAANAGARVTLIDRDLAIAEKTAALAPARITATTEYAQLNDADLVIEAVTEDRAIKADVTQRAEGMLPARAVFGSNTSTLPIGSLSTASAQPERFIGVHFFSPVDRMPLVEIIRSTQTSDETLAVALDFVRFLGKTPIVVHDGRGFFTSRVFATYVHEGLAMLREGVPPALIENAGRLAGMAVGPLAVADEVSLSLMAHGIAQTKADLGSAYVAGPADDVIDLFVRVLDRPGKAAGRGIYAYPTDGKKRLWSELSTAVAPPTNPLDVGTVRDRLLYVQTCEAMRARIDGIIDDPAMGDVGSILGWGFPAFTGGVFSYVDYIGAEVFERRAAELAARFGPRFAPAAVAVAR